MCVWAIVTTRQTRGVERVAFCCIHHICQGDSDSHLNWDLPVALLIGLSWSLRWSVPSVFSDYCSSSNYSFAVPPVRGHLPSRPFQLQWKSVPVTRLNALAEALPASSKAEGLLHVSYRWPSCLHIPACWDFFFCCHMMSLADTQLAVTPDPAKLLSS